MSSIGVGRFGDFARRYLGISGDPPIAREVVPDLNLTLEVSARPDYAFLQGERLCSGHTDTAGVAAQLSSSILLNPANSGILVTVEDVFLLSTNSPSAANFWGIVAGGVLESEVAGNTAFRDQRNGRVGVGRPSAQTFATRRSGAYTQNIGGLLITEALARVPDFVSARLHYPLIIFPGVSVEVWARFENTTLVTGWFWRERPLETTEWDPSL